MKTKLEGAGAAAVPVLETVINDKDFAGDADGLELGQYLKELKSKGELPKLPHLTLINKGLTADGLSILFSVIRDGAADIPRIDISKNNVGALGIAQFAECLRGNQHVTDISFASCEAGDVGAMAIAEMLLSPKCLINAIDCRCNHIGAQGGEMLYRAAQANRHLQRILIGGNQLPETLVSEINETLAGNTTATKGGTTAPMKKRRGTVLEALTPTNATKEQEEKVKELADRTGMTSLIATTIGKPRHSIVSAREAIRGIMMVEETPHIEKRGSIVDRILRRISIPSLKHSSVASDSNHFLSSESGTDQLLTHCTKMTCDERKQFQKLLDKAKKHNTDAIFSIGFMFDIGIGGLEPSTELAIALPMPELREAM